ncbi:MAG: trigger factor [Tepidisphaeraceae bacterium]|jgi:trigger factor
MTDSPTATDTPAATDQAEEIPYEIKIEDSGPATKKVSIEIPETVIATKLEEQFKELRREAAIPGFRPGHAPQKLIEKRFQSDVREQVRRALISESYQKAVEKHSLQVIGEPTFDSPDDIKLPDSGNLSYSFQVEVQPDFTLPPLTGLAVKKQKVEVNDQYVDRAMQNLREQQGAMIPVEDRGVEKGDHLIADVHVKLEGAVVYHEHDAEFVARSGKIAGIQLNDLDTLLFGLRPGEKRDLNARAPATHPEEKIRDRDVVIEIALKDIKKLELAEINEQFLSSLGFANEKELRDALGEQMKTRIEYEVQQSLRDQVSKYLLQEVKIDLPVTLSEKQTERVISRRTLDLLMRGVPESAVEDRMAELRGGAREEALSELKLYFILQKVASMMNIDVSEAELNGRIAIMAAQSGKRPEKVKQEMSADGTLLNMYVQMREQKALDRIIETAQIEEVAAPLPEPE